MSNYLETYKKLKEKYIDEGGTVDENTESEITSNLLKQVEEIGYKPPKITESETLPELSLTKLAEDTRTEDDIKSEVADIVDAKYGIKKQELNSKAQNNIEETNNKITQNVIEKSENEANINKIYDQYVNNMENQALKRGLARSSIIIGQIDGIESERADKLNKSADEYSSKLNSLENEIVTIRSNLKEDLSLLELEKAKEEKNLLDSKLNELTKLKKQIAEFNNDVEKVQAEYELKRKKQELENQKNIEEILNSSVEQDKKKEAESDQYMLIYYTLKKLGKDQALKELFSNEKYADYLGDHISDMYYALRYGK